MTRRPRPEEVLHIYKASAGSGKTYRLAKDYIKMLLGRRDEQGRWHLRRHADGAHRHILAITFTNKATDEMKRRIIHELAVLAGAEPGWSEPSSYLTELTGLFGCTESELSDAAFAALRRLMFDFSFFNVSTIDSFFQTILRTFAREAELEGSYELELEGHTVVTEAVQRLFTDLSDNPDAPESHRIVDLLTSYMVEAVRDKSTKADVFNRDGGPYRSLVSALNSLNNETLAINLDRLDAYYSDPQRISRFFRGVSAAAAGAAEQARDIARGALDTITGMLGTQTTKFIKKYLLDALTKVAAGQEVTGTTLPAVAADGMSAFIGKNTREQPWAADLATVASTAAATIISLRRDSTFFKSLASQRLTMMLISGVMANIRQRRGEVNSLLLSDTNSLLRDIIGDDDAPFVYERMGRWYSHFLIDEFQDTSAMQWANLRPLLAEGIAGGHESLIIGDEKQCIYRFRNSDPDLLSFHAGRAFPGRVFYEPAPPEPGASEPESPAAMRERMAANTNWRSAKAVVELNNVLFRVMSRHFGAEEIYANVEQAVAPAKSSLAGRVALRHVDADPEAHLAMVADGIAAQIAAGRAPGDIIVLARKNDQAAMVIDYLLRLQKERNDYPHFGIVSDDAMKVSASPAVKIIIDSLRRLADGRDLTPDHLHSARRLHRLIGGFEAAVARGLEPHEALEAAVAGAAVSSDTAADPSQKSGITPDTAMQDAGAVEIDLTDAVSSWSIPLLIERIASEEVPRELRDAQQVYISALLDAAADYCSREQAGLSEFVAWWDANGHRLRVSSAADSTAIRVMTVHKAKGLEAPCVHLPFVNYDAVKFIGVEWFDTEGIEVPGVDPADVPPLIVLRPSAKMMVGTPLQEQYERRVQQQRVDELNALYVGFTRACEELDVYFTAKTKSDGSYAGTDMVGNLLHESVREAFGVDIAPGEDYTVTSAATAPRAATSTRRTALTPARTDTMPPFTTTLRPRLWTTTLMATPD